MKDDQASRAFVQMLDLKNSSQATEAMDKGHEEDQLLESGQAQAHEQRLKAQYAPRDRNPHGKALDQKKIVKLTLATVAGLLVVLLPVVGMHAVQDQRDHDRAAAAYQHMKARVPEGFPIQIPEGAGEPIKKAPKPPEAAEIPLPVFHPGVNHSRLLKPGFHLTPLHGWMNDPNGMFQAPDGKTHVFYQLNPVAPVWGSPWWGHVASEDMAHWRRLPPALKPDQWYDKDGVFSGSATLLPNGSVVLLYTGVIDSAQYGFLYQLQAVAMPSNASDPWLVDWSKVSTNPTSIEIPPGGTHAQFRDPITAWALSVNELMPALHQWGIQVVCASGSSSASSSSGMPSAHISAAEEGQSSSGGSSGSSGEETRKYSSDSSGEDASQGSNGSSGEETSKDSSDSSEEETSGGGSAAGEASKEGGEDCSNKLVYMTAVGTMNNCLGGASLYVSMDELRSWKYVGSLFSQLGQNFTYYATCLPPPEERDRGDDIPPGSKGYGGHCDQFGKDCRMWECPDFFDTSTQGVQAFKYSDQARERPQFAQDFYVLSDAQLTNYSLAGLQDGKDAYSGMIQGEYYPATPLDYGVVYASKSFQATDKRRLWLGWVFEDSLGCTELCADGTPFIQEVLRWQGAQTLLREVTYNPDTQALRFYPIAETRRLRVGEPLYDDHFLLHTHADKGASFTQLLLPEERSFVVSGLQGGGASAEGRAPAEGTHSPALSPSHPSSRDSSPSGRRQAEVLLNFTLQAELSLLTAQDLGRLHPFEVALELLTGNGTVTRIRVNGTAAVPGGGLANSQCGTLRPSPRLLGEQWSCVHEAAVWVDREHSGGMSKTSAQGGPIKLPARGVKATDLSLDVWVDRSLLEVYAFDGSAVVTSRIYPVPVVERKHHDAALPSQAQGVPASKEEVQLGAWGYQVSARWGLGHVKVNAEVHELGSCWVDEEDR